MNEQTRLAIHNVEDAMEIARMAGLFRPWLPEASGDLFASWLFARRSAVSPTSMQNEIAAYFQEREDALRHGEDLERKLRDDIEFALDWESISRHGLRAMADCIERVRQAAGGDVVMRMFVALAVSTGRSIGRSKPSIEHLMLLQQLLTDLHRIAGSLQIELQGDAGDVYRGYDAGNQDLLAQVEESLRSRVRRFGAI